LVVVFLRQVLVKIIADRNIPFVAECFSSMGEVKVVSGREMTAEVVRDADVLLVRSVTPVNSELLAGSKVRFVATATIGFDHVDVAYLAENEIGFASAPGSNANSAAEYVVAALLCVARKKRVDLEGKSIGIVGVGNVGSRVARKAAALGMRVYLNDPPLQRQTGDAKYLQIEALYDCDFVTFHTPLTFEGIDKTFHLADEKFFKSLKAGCVFLNTSRGGVVDSAALKAAIRAGKFGAVVLDVWENEPNIDTELLEMVDIGTPHIAGYSLDGKIAGMIMIYEAACKYFGLEPRHSIEDFLPEPSVPQLEIDPKAGTEQEIVQQAAEKIYDINRDDSDLRQVFDRPVEERGEFFDGLRKNYSVRREFQNTQVVLQSPCKGLTEKLAGIGFRVADDPS
jgi:erythronate-4-phosphate dehydrogenase